MVMHRLWFVFLLVLPIGCGSRGPVVIPEAGKLKELPPGIHQETATVPTVGTLPYTIDIPRNYDGKTPVPLVLLLHYGYEGSKPEPYTGRGMLEAFRPAFSELDAILVAPDALGGDWTDANNEKAAIWLTKSVMKAYAVDSNKVVITGYSLGGEGTWFLGSRHQDLFTAALPVAAPIAGGNVDWKIPVYVIHSRSDEVVPYSPAKRHADAIKGKGTKLEFKTVSGLGHYETNAYAPHVREGVTWLEAQWNETTPAKE
jgi:predicted peptidase